MILYDATERMSSSGSDLEVETDIDSDAQMHYHNLMEWPALFVIIAGYGMPHKIDWWK